MKQILLFLFVTFFFLNATAQTEECGTKIPENTTFEMASPYGLINEVEVIEFFVQKHIPLALHIVQRTNGTGGLSGTILNQALTLLDIAYIQANIDFYKYSLDYINNDIYFNSVELYATGTSEKFIPGNGHYLAEYLYHFNGNFWNLIDSNITSTNYNRISFPTVLRNINGSLYGIMDGKFVKKNGNSWLTIKSGIYGQFNGNNNKNIFLANQDFGVLHYNGTDWFRFEELPWFHYYDVEVFEDAVFFLATDGYMSYIVKGTIK